MGEFAVVAVSRKGTGGDSFTHEVVCQFDGLLAFVDKDDDFLGSFFSFFSLLGGIFANVPDGLGAGEVSVSLIGDLFNIDDGELDATGNGVEVGGNETESFGEALVEEGVERFGDSGGAEDELVEGRGAAVDEGGRGRGETSIQETVGFVDDEVGDTREDVGVGFADGVEEMRGGDENVDSRRGEQAVADDGSSNGGGNHGGAEFDGVGEGFEELADLGDEFGGGEEDDGARTTGGGVGCVGSGEREGAVFDEGGRGVV